MDVAVGTSTNHNVRGGHDKREHPPPPPPPPSVTFHPRTAGTSAAERREETTDEYPVAGGCGDVAMEVDDGHHSDRHCHSPAPSGNDENVKPEVEIPRKPSGSAARKKKRKRKRRDLPIPRPEVGPEENLVQIHTVWSRGRRTKGGYVVKSGDKVVRYIDSKGIIYCPEDTIYLDTKEPDQPFFICSIFGFTLKKRDTLSLVVKWFFRVSELPISVRDHLLQDRHNEHGSGIIRDPEIKSRELFISKSNATDTFPVSQLRGKCQVVHYQDIGSARAFKPSPDVFFYVLGYNPQTKRLATTQGEIRVGASHQAALPECRPDLPPSLMPEECHEYEELRWQPNRVQDSDLFMYLQAARSIAAFAGMCDGAEPEHSAVADETTMNALDILHKFDYDTSKALQALVKCPARKTLEKKWGEEDSKHFVKGLKQYGKNFFQIKKTLLPRRQTGELIEYYYYWKKTQNAVSNRHQVKKLKKSKKTTRSSQPDVEFLDHSSVSECSDDSEDSDAGRDLKDYTCQHCFTNESKDWHHAGKERGLLCTECRLFYKKYGEARPLDGDKDGSQYLFKPVKEEDDTLNGKHNMRTRRGNSAGETKEKKTERSNSTSSPDIEGVSSRLGPNSPSVASTGSCSSNDKDAKDNNNAQSKPESKSKKRRNGDLEEGKLKKSRSDSESMIDSSEASGNEDLGNEADSDDNNQDDLSASSQPSTPSSLDTEFKSAKDYIKPEPLPQSPLVGLPHPQPRPLPAPVTASAITTTTTTACTATPVVTPAPITQDSNSNPLGFSLGGRYTSTANPPMLPVGATFGDVKPPLGLYPHPHSHPHPHPHAHPLVGGLGPLPPRHPAESPSVSAPSSETGGLSSGGVPPPPGTLSAPGGHSGGHSVASLIPHSSNNNNSFSTSSSALSSASTTPSTVFSSSASSSLPAAAVSTSANASMMTSMSSTGVTLMSSGSGSAGDGEREKKYTPPSPSQPPPHGPGMGGALFAPYSFFPYGPHLGPPRLGGPPPPVPSLVPIKKEPGEGSRMEGPDMKDSSSEPHTLHRPLPQALPASAVSSIQSSSSQSEQKLPHMPVPPPLTSIESPLPGGLVERGGMVGHPSESLRDNSRETILREAREISLLAATGGVGVGGGVGIGNVSSIVPGDHGPRTLFPPPLTSLPPSATVTSSSMPHALAGNIPHHLPVAVSMGQGEPPRPDLHHPSADHGLRGSSGGGMGPLPPSLRNPHTIPRVEDGGIVEEVMDDSDSDREGSTTPGPNPTPCNKEVMRSKSAFFIKVLDRGERNSCSRCDLVFKPLPSSALAKKREERARRATASSMTQSSNSHSSSRDEKPRERRPETPPKSASVESQSASSSATPSQHGGLYPERHTPRPYPLANPDTPALRQLSEYARPHAMGQDPQRAAFLGLAGHPHMDPLASYRHLAMYPPGSRERLELELERDKRERDAREREMRERELREMELREKMKADMDLKPPGMPASKAGLDRLLPPGANPLDPHWLEMQRRLAYPPGTVLPPGGPGSGGSNHLPGVYPPVSLAGELAAREREKLERLGVAGGHHPHLPVDLSYASVVERLSAERQQAERLGLVPPSNPEALARLQMASLATNQAAAAAAAMHAHTHAHTHSHTHLHLHQQQENNLAAAAAALAGGGGVGGNGMPTHIHPLAHHLYPHLSFPAWCLSPLANLTGADPMAGLSSASATATSLHPGSQPPLLPGASSREQAELLQRELYSRAYMDPALAHQLTAQAAHHEAIQRQLAMERERFGPGHLPH